MNCHKFTEAEDRTILEMRAAGKPWAAIGRALELGYETCKYRYVKYLDPKSRHVKKRKIVREEEEGGIRLKFDPSIVLDVTYEDDPRADKRPPVFTVGGKSYWAEKRSMARGDFDWGLNPVMPKL